MQANDSALPTVGGRIRTLRESQEWTLTAFAQSVGVSKGHLSKIETGHQMPKVVVLLAISEELGVPMNALLGGIRKPSTKRNKGK